MLDWVGEAQCRTFITLTFFAGFDFMLTKPHKQTVHLVCLMAGFAGGEMAAGSLRGDSLMAKVQQDRKEQTPNFRLIRPETSFHEQESASIPSSSSLVV